MSSGLQNTILQALNTEIQKVPGYGQGGIQASAFDQDVYNDLIKAGLSPLQAAAAQNYMSTNQYGGSSGVIGKGGGAAGFMPQWLQNNANQWAPGMAAAVGAVPGPGPGGKPAAGQPGGKQTPAQQQAQSVIQPSYMPAPPTAQATQSAANVDPSTTLAMILQGFTPQAQSSNIALQNQLAAAGIQGGGALDATTALQRNLAAGLAPTLGQAVQSAQGMTLEQALANAASQNQMTGLNVQDWMNTNLANMEAANQAKGQLGNYLMQGWLDPMSMFGGLNSQGLGGQQSLSQINAQNFPVYQQSPIWGMLGQAAGTAIGSMAGNPFAGFGAKTAQQTYTPGVSQAVPGGNVSGGGGFGWG